MSQWVKVEFYGLLPDDGMLTEFDVPTLANQVGLLFGFSYLDGLSLTLTDPALIDGSIADTSHSKDTHNG